MKMKYWKSFHIEKSDSKKQMKLILSPLILQKISCIIGLYQLYLCISYVKMSFPFVII